MKPEFIRDLFKEKSGLYVTALIQERADLREFLEYLKENNIEHDDLHSSNIMIDKNDSIEELFLILLLISEKQLH